MIVLRFKVNCRPEKTEEALAAFRAVIAPSREVEGVISFDIARDLVDPNSVVAVEVFEDEAARDRQESLPEVATVMKLLPDAVAAPPEASDTRRSSPPRSATILPVVSQSGSATPSGRSFQPSLEAIHSAPARISTHPGSETAKSDQ